MYKNIGLILSFCMGLFILSENLYAQEINNRPTNEEVVKISPPQDALSEQALQDARNEVMRWRNNIPQTGQDLFNLTMACSIVPDSGCKIFTAGLTMGYLGVIQSLNLPPVFCFPKELDDNMISQSLIKFISEEPLVMYAPAQLVFLKALISNFPCNPGEKK